MKKVRHAPEERKVELRAWVLENCGDGTTAPCAGCGELVDCRTVTLDRFPIPGKYGGRYTRDNVRPMCVSCNSGHVGEPGWPEQVEWERWVMGSQARKERPLSYRIHVALPEHWRKLAKTHSEVL